MKKILAFGGSNSKNSINKSLAKYVAEQVNNVEITVLDLNDYELPIYGYDLENESGIPVNAQKFLNKIVASDGIVLSLAEHNGAYTTAFKNVFDWMSRIDGKLWNNKPMLLLATSPGGRGGRSVLEIAKSRFPYMGGNIVADFSLPFFSKNFTEDGIDDEALSAQLNTVIAKFNNALN
jgi:NAD(P)H-dependent FMN reductase